MSSLRERVLPMAIGLGSAVFLALIYHFSNRAAFLTLSGVWVALLVAYFFRLGRKPAAATLPIVIATALACLNLLLLSEWRGITAGILFIAGVSMAYLARIHGRTPSPSEWPVWRRALMMLMVFDTYALTTGLFAIYLFFPGVPFWLISGIGVAIMTAAAVFIWRLYGYAHWNQIGAPALIMAVVSFELLWSLHFLPFEYGAFGLIAAWLWYLTQLFVRWHLSPADVVWRKQRWFLLANAALLAFILAMYVRWV